MVVLASSGLLSMLEAALVAAGLMIASGCTSGQVARRAPDWQVLVVIATSFGIGVALQKTGGKLTTFEIDAQRAATARENFKKAGMADIITVVLGDAHEKVKDLKDPIDVLFLDADKEGFLRSESSLIQTMGRAARLRHGGANGERHHPSPGQPSYWR